MGLKETAEELKEQIAAAEKAENEAIEKEISEEEKPKEPEKEEPAKKEEEKPEEKAEETKEEPKKTNADFAKERREKASREKKLADELSAAHARIAELSKPRDEPVKQQVEAEPDKAEDPTAWMEWHAKQTDAKLAQAEEKLTKVEKLTENELRLKHNERLQKQAESELLNFEKSAKTQADDFEDVKTYYVHKLAYSIKTLRPDISDGDLLQSINTIIMQKAKQKLDEGYENPALAMYDEIKADGYQPSKKEEKEPDALKPDLDRVAKNRGRNAGMAGAGGGNGRGEVTKRFAATEMTSAEWAKLPASERQRIMASQ